MTVNFIAISISLIPIYTTGRVSVCLMDLLDRINGVANDI